MTTRRYPWPGAVVNPDRPAPNPPGEWVSAEACSCGATYHKHRGCYSFQMAVDQLRDAAKACGDEGGGFRSRRAVLWWLRCMKLADWYLTHAGCGVPLPEPSEDCRDYAVALDAEILAM